MKPNQYDIDDRIIRRYTDQPAQLPPDLRVRIEQSWGGAPVQLYALADLDDAMQLASTWVVLGPTHMAVVPIDESSPASSFSVFERARIVAVQEAPGLSGTVLTIVGAGSEALARVSYTNRQRPAFENLRFVIEEQLEGRSVETADADRVYAEAIARPIRDTQSLVASRRGGALFRLLRYLLPYKRELALGMGAATII